MTKHTNVITLPRAFTGLGSRYVTRSGALWQPETVALCLALTLRQHGTVDAVRATAKHLASRVCMEQQPRLRALSRRPTNEHAHQRDPRVRLNGVPDAQVLTVALNIVNRVCALTGVAPEQPFELLPLVEPPRCHYKPMRLAGTPDARHWKCQHCSHTKPITLDTDADHAHRNPQP